MRPPVRFQKGEKLVVLEIRDNGKGIPEDKLKNIWDPFFTTKRGKGGHGLGLRVVKNIIEMHQGKITITNSPEGGAVVRISLRCARGKDEV